MSDFSPAQTNRSASIPAICREDKFGRNLQVGPLTRYSGGDSTGRGEDSSLGVARVSAGASPSRPLITALRLPTPSPPPQSLTPPELPSPHHPRFC
jgi:hypothetical protein